MKYCSFVAMWNEICPHSRQRIFHICGANISQRSYFTCPQGKFRWKKHLLSQVLFSGGSGWIRTTEVTDNRFTVCPLWPLGNTPLKSVARIGAGERSRTINLLITNQLLCHWATPAYSHEQSLVNGTCSIIADSFRFVNSFLKNFLPKYFLNLLA